MEDIFRKRRTIRRFTSKNLAKEDILDIIDSARYSPSAANLQPLKYIASCNKKIINRILPFLHWAGYIKPKRDPLPGKEPKAFIIVCSDQAISDSIYVAYDVGAAIQTILLAAYTKGIGGCWIAAIEEKNKIKELFSLPQQYLIHAVVALGYPDEFPLAEQAVKGNIRYYLDEQDTLHVPKRSLEEILYWIE